MTGLRARLAELPRVYWILWVGTLINRLGGFVVPFLALYLTRERGLSVAEAGGIASLAGLGSFLAGPIGGSLADRVGRRPTMLLGLVGGAAALLGLGFARGLPQIAVATLCFGLVSDLYRPAVAATIADVVPPEQRLHAYGLLYWAVNLGFSAAPILAGLMVRQSYLLLFVADAATTFVYALIVWRLVPETRPAAAPPVHGARAGGWRDVYGDGVFMAFVLMTFLLGAIFHQSAVAMPIQMAEDGISASTYGLVLALNGILIITLQPFMTRGIASLPRSHVLAAASLLSGVGFGLYAFVGTAAWYAVGVVIWTLGEIASAPVGSSIVADLAPADLRGRYQGAYTMAWGLAAFAGPSAGALVMEAHGAQALWLGCLGLSIVVAAGHLAIAGARRRRMAILRAVRS